MNRKDLPTHDKEYVILKEMFPELRNCSPVEEKVRASWNDGGFLVGTTWEGPGHHYQTEFNTWSVRHPDTSISEVKRKIVKKVEFETLWRKYYG